MKAGNLNQRSEPTGSSLAISGAHVSEAFLENVAGLLLLLGDLYGALFPGSLPRSESVCIPYCFYMLGRARLTVFGQFR